MSTINLNSYVSYPNRSFNALLLMPNLEWIIFTEVKYETLSIPIPILEGCLVSLFAGLEQWNELWNGPKQNIKNIYLP